MAQIAAPHKGATDGTGLIQWDPWLEPYAHTLRARYAHYSWLLKVLDEREGGLVNFAHSYTRFGLHRGMQQQTPGTYYREWAPGACSLSLVGEFNGWDRGRNPCSKNGFGVWECFVPDRPDGTWGIAHGSKVKVAVETRPGTWEHRVPAWATRVVQQGSPVFDGQFWCPPENERHVWKHPSPARPKALRIYEAHIGMATQELRVGSYREFADNVVPYVADLGYNAVQLMAVMEHAYYSSFGYQVTSFFAVSSRFGTPEDLKHLIDECHARGLHVLLDVVHSHASNNVEDGLNMWDGTDHHYFHGLPLGRHPMWDSRLFNYGNWETLRFLLSNLAWFLEEYRFDGFRFDGVTSMLYRHHGVGDYGDFNYDHYFGGAVDSDALAYMTLANELVHRINPNAVTIAEDVSGFAGMCRPTTEGGVGFDYRLAMACPDLWVHTLKKLRDEDWNVSSIAWTLSNRRFMEPCIAYAESHDQALVGDKTIAFWLMDKEMYDFMSDLTPLTPIIDRGIALHKMIRLITCVLGGEGYLNFMGNEFGHPEWVDFPRPGNGNSYHHARRQWNLVKDPLLRYKYLFAFDKAMIHLEQKYSWLAAAPAYISVKNEGDKLVAFERADLLCIFNFNPTKSFVDYRIPVRAPGEYHIVLDTDRPEFCGHSRVDPASKFFSQDYAFMGFPQSIQVYIPCRTALVLRRKELI